MLAGGWCSSETLFSELQLGRMNCYESFDHFTQQEAIYYDNYEVNERNARDITSKIEFDFG